MTPQARVTFIEDKFQRDLTRIEKVLAGQAFELIGTKRKPRGIKVKTNTKTIGLLKRLSYVSWIYNNNKAKKEKKKNEESYFCFKVIFQIQVEGQKRGNQTIEERFLLVKSNNWDKAEQKVKREFKNYEKPYLNPYGQMVRWTFDYIEESYHTYISDKDDFTKPIEVFSKLKGRSLKKENIWNGD
jgi:hypothetical protein